MKIEKFEDIKAWQEARVLVNMVYELTESIRFKRDQYALKDQLHRAVISILANIAEGFDSQSDSEFTRFLRYALRSTTEVQSLLYVVLDRKLINTEKFDEIYKQCQAVKNFLAGFIRYLRKEKLVNSPATLPPD